MMKASRLIRLALLFITAAALLSASAAAIGVSPGRQTINFEPKAHHTISFDIINDQHKDIKLLVTVEGEAKGTVISLKEQIVHMKAGEERKRISYDAYMPEKFDEPGMKEVRIVVTQMPYADEQQVLQVGAVAGVVSQLRINVPYEGKYIGVDEIEVSGGNTGSIMEFIVPINNIGTEEIANLSTSIMIMGPTNEPVAVLKTEDTKLEPKRRVVAKAEWLANVNPGKYFAVAVVSYDENSARKEKVFAVGGIDVEILGMKSANFKLGGIAQIDVTLRSKWNEKLENVYGEMFISDSVGEPVTELKTASIDLLPNSKSQVHAYWDTKEMNEGKYYATFRLHLAKDAFIDKKFEIALSLTNLEANMLGLTAMAAKGEPRDSMLMTIILVLILINIGWFIYMKKMRKAK